MNRSTPMVRAAARFTMILGAAALAACGGGGSGNPSPALPLAQPFHAARPAAANLRLARGRGRAQFVIRLPLLHMHPGTQRKPHYISPATQSLAIAVDSASPTVTNLTPKSPNCTVSGPISYLQCTIEISVFAGTHTFSLITYDQPNAAGNILSANTNVPFTVVSGSNQPLAVTLGGVAASLAVLAPNVPQVVGSQFDGFTVFGNKPVSFTILPVDADGNYMMGPGAPMPSVTAAPSSPLLVATPKHRAPNSWPLTSTYAPVDPTIARVVRLTAVATPVPNSGGPTVTAPVTYALFQPWIYVTNQSDWKVGVSDEYGHARTLSGQGFSELPDPSGIAYDSHNYWPYVPSIDDNAVCVYDVEGNLMPIPTNWSNLRGPTDIIYVASNLGDRLYTANSSFFDIVHRHQGGSGRLLLYNPAQSGGVSAYDENGNQLSTPGGFLGLEGPRALAFDSNNAMLYVTDDGIGTSTVLEFDLQGNFQQSFSATLPANSGYGGIAYDSHNGLLYAVDNNSIVTFDENGTIVKPSGTNGTVRPEGAAAPFGGLTNPVGIAYDPYDGFIYITEGSPKNKVKIFTESGLQQPPAAGFASNGTNPWGVVAIP